MGRNRAGNRGGRKWGGEGRQDSLIEENQPKTTQKSRRKRKNRGRRRHKTVRFDGIRSLHQPANQFGQLYDPQQASFFSGDSNPVKECGIFSGDDLRDRPARQGLGYRQHRGKAAYKLANARSVGDSSMIGRMSNRFRKSMGKDNTTVSGFHVSMTFVSGGYVDNFVLMDDEVLPEPLRSCSLHVVEKAELGDKVDYASIGKGKSIECDLNPESHTSMGLSKSPDPEVSCSFKAGVKCDEPVICPVFECKAGGDVNLEACVPMILDDCQPEEKGHRCSNSDEESNELGDECDVVSVSSEEDRKATFLFNRRSRANEQDGLTDEIVADYIENLFVDSDGIGNTDDILSVLNSSAYYENYELDKVGCSKFNMASLLLTHTAAYVCK